MTHALRLCCQVLEKGSTSHSKSVSGISRVLSVPRVQCLWSGPDSFLMEQTFSVKAAMANNPQLISADDL